MKTMNYLRVLSILSFGSMAAGAAAFTACDTEEPTKTVLENNYPAPADGGDPSAQTVVYRAWWLTTYFPDPVPAETVSTEQRTVPASDVAYAVLAPGWDPASNAPPTKLVVVKSKAPLSVARGDTLHIALSDQTFTGNCAAQQPLSQEDADFITRSIFPGEFTNATYDAKTCTTTAVPTDDAGPDAGAQADAEAGSDAGAD